MDLFKQDNVSSVFSQRVKHPSLYLKNSLWRRKRFCLEWKCSLCSGQPIAGASSWPLSAHALRTCKHEVGLARRRSSFPTSPSLPGPLRVSRALLGAGGRATVPAHACPCPPTPAQTPGSLSRRRSIWLLGSRPGPPSETAQGRRETGTLRGPWEPPGHHGDGDIITEQGRVSWTGFSRGSGTTVVAGQPATGSPHADRGRRGVMG